MPPRSTGRWLWIASGLLLATCRPSAPLAATNAALPAGAGNRPNDDAASPPSWNLRKADAPRAERAAKIARWSTAPASDACVEFSGLYVPARSFPSKAECEAWVHERECRPGDRCLDGLNWVSCVWTGEGAVRTALAPVKFAFPVGFRAGTADLPRTKAIWDDLLDRARKLLKAPRRKLAIWGFAAPDDASTSDARRALAEERARVVLRGLVQRGIPQERLELAAELPDSQFNGPIAGMIFVPDPDIVAREDLDPNSVEYRDFCGR